MKTSATITLVLALAAPAYSGPAWAKEKCTSECYLFAAWAMAQLCPNVTLIHTPQTDKDYKEFFDGSRPMRELQADALRDLRRAIAVDRKNACHPTNTMTEDNRPKECTGAEDDVGTVCQYVKERK
jgi:hypothetical protein